MNYIFPGMILLSLIFSAVNGSVDQTVAAGINAAKESVFTLLGLTGAMCFWTGLLNIAQNCGVGSLIERLLSPVIAFLFPGAGEKAKQYISMNMTANILGMGNASTPMGMQAMQALDEENKGAQIPSKNMCMLVAANTTSIQLIPTTVLALRTAAGSVNPSAVILPIWLTSLTAFLITVLSVKLLIRGKS